MEKFVDYKKMIDMIIETAIKRIYHVSNDIRNNVIIPFCIEHGIKFTSGMGTYIFTKNGEIIDISELKGGKEVLEILEITVSPAFPPNCPIGIAIADVK